MFLFFFVKYIFYSYNFNFAGSFFNLVMKLLYAIVFFVLFKSSRFFVVLFLFAFHFSFFLFIQHQNTKMLLAIFV